MVLMFLGDLRQAIHFPLILVAIVLLIDYPFGYNSGTKSSWVLVLEKKAGGMEERFKTQEEHIP